MRGKIGGFFLGVVLAACSCPALWAAGSDEIYPGFSLHKQESGSGPTLLVIGGIQGDEPGGFSAASLLVTHYKINKGSLWVVPNLNFPSIACRNRGLHGDMNRKFAAIKMTDPEYDTVTRIKEIILDRQVDLVLNLHDGSGFYRAKHENALYNPQRWGQSLIIDQEEVDAPRYGQLNKLGEKVCADVNKRLLNKRHGYTIKNTRTRGNDHEMERSLSYFAVCNQKAAFGVEASKELSPEIRSYYHILVLESFMRQLGLEFTRKFSLDPAGVMTALNKDLTMRLYGNRLVLPLENSRASLGIVPVKRDNALHQAPSNPLLAVVRSSDNWRVIYGNRTLTRLIPQYMDFDDSEPEVEFLVDGRPAKARIGEIVRVKKEFLVKSQDGYRVNAIGAVKERNGSECNVPLRLDDFAPRFSLDNEGTIYRVEFYKDKAFTGMILVNFGNSKPAPYKMPLTATTGAESNLGR